MRNPLTKRIPREIKNDLGKYIALFLFLILSIGFISGFLVAGDSMKSAFDNSFEKYNVEDGHFCLAAEIDDKTKENVENLGVKLYKNFYVNKDLDNGNTFRLFKNRTDFNEIAVFEGNLPENNGEIAIDRLYAENNEIKVGDKIKVADKDMTISATVAFSDYTSLFKNNTDMMFDAKKFSVAVVTDSDFNKIADDNYAYCYSWIDNDKNLSDSKKNDLGDDVKEELVKTGMLTDFVKRADNQAIMFSGDDIGSDKTMMLTLLYVLIIVFGFIFAITSRDTVEQEASVIGTLRASGYTRGELTRHYLVVPTLVTFVAAVIGNILGYTAMKNVVMNMYYHSYSLPPYQTLWNGDAFILTTVIPCIIIILINLFVIAKALRLPPLQFLRHDFHMKKKKKAAKIPNFIFLTRFRLRIILQNIPSYIIMVFGIMFAGLLLFFGLALNPLLSNYKTEVVNNMICDYQYVLKAPVETSNDAAEKFCMTTLYESNDEEISAYGIENGSEYLSKVNIPKKKNEVVASQGYLEKYSLKVGDRVTLKDKYGENKYTFKIVGSYYYPASLCVFMTNDNFNDVFDKDDGYFTGYFSNEKLKDIDDKYIATTITQKDLTTVTDQLDDSMGMSFTLLVGFSVLIYIILMYLLSKLVIEKNEQNISMLKILGYSNREASKLYNRATTVVTIGAILVSVPLIYYVFSGLYHYFMFEMKGWLPYVVPWYVFVEMAVIGIICYAIIYFILQKKINKIKLSQALKSDD